MGGVGWIVFAWGSIAVFTAVTIYRVVSIARLPVHLRWELSPVPHGRGKGDHGGSYLEEHEWWKKKRNTSFFGPIAYLSAEILLLRGIWRHNRSLWPLSLALHGGFYLFILVLVAHFCLVVLSASGISSLSSAWVQALSLLTVCACTLGTVGSAGLIVKRVSNRGMRWSNTVGTFLNLILAGAVFVSGLVAWAVSPESAKTTSEFVAGLLSLRGPAEPGWPLAVHVTLVLIFSIYIPFTSMLHFAGKYFLYHGVRWNDRPVDGLMEGELRKLISQPVTWDRNRTCGEEPSNWATLAREGTGNAET